MTNTDEFVIKVGDRIPSLEIQLLDYLEDPFDLTGYDPVTITIAPCVGGRAIVRDAEVEIIDAANGIVQYHWLVGDTDYAGEYKVEAIVWNGTKKGTFPGGNYGKVTIVEHL